MKKLFKILPVISILLVAMLFFGCGQSAENNDGTEGGSDAPKTDLVLASGPSGGTFEVVAASTVEILKSAVPELKLSIVPGGSTSNVGILSEGKADISMCPADAAYLGQQGLPPYSQKYENVRGLISLYPNTLQVWVRKDSGIKDLPDFKGKSYSFGQPGGLSYQAGLNLLEIYGLNPEDGKMKTLAWNESVDALRDGNIDLLLWTTSYPAPAIVDAMMNTDIELIQLDPEMVQKFQDKYPAWVDLTISAGTYKTQTEDVTTLGSPVFFGVDEGFSEETAYQITKALFENKDQLANAHVLLNYITEETAAAGMAVPLHPGAEKYYKEVGIIK
ncbi:MAG: TAXI family TRAP transporter solute-binding subunit [Desulfitobacteriaceae bacterium]|nr:TAXI family TRAP transporter solute-binding subunit [Desulfitobacteriaceae bacterium]MDD4753804.1 TAXI family TRAP transporter solute-binding subunit [Desulfitobacteriaceae bacterium]